MFEESRLTRIATECKVPFWLTAIDRRTLCMSNDRRVIVRILTQQCVEFFSIEINREGDWQTLREQLQQFASTPECQTEWAKYVKEFGIR